MIWNKFELIQPEQHHFPILVVWYKGDNLEKQLAVTWKSLQELLTDHDVTTTDKVVYWTQLTDPEEQKVFDTPFKADSGL